MSVQEDIPPTRAARSEVVDAARALARSGAAVPPLGLEELRRCARKMLEDAGIDRKYERYAGVLLNNELWRQELAGVPFDRRLLLLPQCLRDAEACRADIDEVGLTCAHCGRCVIHDLQQEAESLGYVVLVAEGSPIVMSLIESGQIQAVIGVSCLDALEQVFPYMEAAAIPGMAIPLLHDGCKNTCLDLSWAWDAIHLTGRPATPHLDLEDLRRRVAAWFQPEALSESLGRPSGQTEEAARQWLAAEGKRWRPLLVACTYQALRGDGRNDIGPGIRQAAVAIECFHKASLVHDDIEDNDPQRYGRPTLHERFGTAFALNVGDLLLGEGYRLLAELPVSAEQRAAMLAAAAGGHRTLCLGQGAELHWAREPGALGTDEVLEIFRRKTAPAFEVALQLGAICAGAGEGLHRTLAAYSQALGVAYQIRDDLEDFTGNRDGGDLQARRPSILLAVAWDRAGKEDRPTLLDAWRGAAAGADGIERVRRLLDRLEVGRATERLMEFYKDQAVACLSSLDNTELKRLLRRLLARVFGDAEVMGCCNDVASRDA